ncbi:MAG: HAMP domain-containing histidine kinase [Woeseiaceae bacterium]|nr:HAMP domain-containing histidine kinase [Woeseiaceae bacterium]
MPVIEKVVDNAQLEADHKNVTIKLGVSGDNVFVPVNDLLLGSAIENVLRNAIQAAPNGSQVRVAGRINGNNVEIRIADTGPGVPDDALKKIFEPFVRLDTNRSGSGIGLAITARVLERIGGSVAAENANDGGLTVTLTIPVVAEASVATARPD